MSLFNATSIYLSKFHFTPQCVPGLKKPKIKTKLKYWTKHFFDFLSQFLKFKKSDADIILIMNGAVSISSTYHCNVINFRDTSNKNVDADDCWTIWTAENWNVCFYCTKYIILVPIFIFFYSKSFFVWWWCCCC